MVPVWLILIPLLTGLVSFILKDAKTVKAWALLSSLITLALIVAGNWFFKADSLQFSATWGIRINSGRQNTFRSVRFLLHAYKPKSINELRNLSL